MPSTPCASQLGTPCGRTAAAPGILRMARRAAVVVFGLGLGLAPAGGARAQELRGEVRDPIPPQVETLYLRGLNFLAGTQTEAGNWTDNFGQQPGVVGLAVLAMLAHGDDPNVGPYHRAIKRGVEFILSQANADNGYIGNSMYNHGFATLALAEAYGTLRDERIGPALKKAVGLILLAQKSNAAGAWRYAPEAPDADITVSGSQMVALLAARNAGLEVPESAIQSGLAFMAKCQGADGSFGYTPGSAGTGSPRGAIAVLAYALARQKDSPVYLAGARYIQKPEAWSETGNYHYFLYYLSQALFHSEMDVWTKWNETNTGYLTRQQNKSGSWSADTGEVFGTAMSLLSLALNYRFLPIYER